jgi:predicted nucleotidyltransferase
MEALYKDTLNPKFWSDNQFDSEIRQKILQIVSDFIKETKLATPIKDITLTGSLANFNYNKYSDLDIHIILDFKKVDPNEQLVKDALNGKRFIWNLRHNILLRGHEIELYFQDSKEPHYATAVFSVLRNKWIVEPKYNPPGEIDMETLVEKADGIKDTIDRMLKSLDETKDLIEINLIHKKAKLIKDKIIKVRGEALRERGEFAFENLLFKRLRNEGVIENLIITINKSYDKMFEESHFVRRIAKFLKEEL